MPDAIDWFVPLVEYVCDVVMVAANPTYGLEYGAEANASKRWADLLKHEGEPHDGDCTGQPQTCLQCQIATQRQEARYLYGVILKWVTEGYPPEEAPDA